MSSFIWKHFTLITNSIAKCNYCPIQYNTKKTTASLRYHVKSKHPHKVRAEEHSDELDTV